MYSCLQHTITGHAWLAWDTSWDDNDLSALEGSSQTGLTGLVTNNLDPSAIAPSSCYSLRYPYCALGVDVANISGNTWCHADIV